jgi:FAD/FMN-containing dehydrogenase
VAHDAPDAFLSKVEAVVGSANVVTDHEVIGSYAVDWTGRFRGDTTVVVRPADTDEVAAVLRLCNEARVALVPQGGNTGLVGGGVPLAGELLLSLRRLRRVDDVDRDALQVTAEAGVPLAQLQRHARAAGLTYGIDLAARDVATLGGTIATNAGGVHVLRYGNTRRQLLGVEVVLADGTHIRHLDGLLKDNTGYDLPGLLCGSEGTLGIVTTARVRLLPRNEHVVVALLAFGSVAAAVAAVGECRRRVDTLQAAELFLADGLSLVCDAFGWARPFAQQHAAYLLLEAAGPVDQVDIMSAAVAAAAPTDVAVATDTHLRERLWAYRDQHTAAINNLGAPHKLDVTLPMSQIASFVDQVRAAVNGLDANAYTWLFGHVGDGNVHVNVTGVDPSDTRVDDTVLHLVARLGGSISAEHGIGTAKKRWLHLNRSPAEIETFRRIKDGLDPHGILNPNVLLP